MPAQDGEFYPLSEKAIKNNLEDNLKDLLDKSADPGNLVTKQLESEAKTLAQNQEKALERVYYAGYLEDATGKELDKLVDLLGLTRQEESSATGTATFSRKTPPSTTYPIPKGTQIQTEGLPPIQFEMTEKSQLQVIEDWESNNLDNWFGDINDFTIVESDKLNGNFSVEAPAIAGAEIQWSNSGFSVGTTFDAEINPQSGSITEFRVAKQDDSNYQAAIIDASAGQLKLETVEGGAVVKSSSTSLTIPTAEKSHVEFRWSLHGDHRLTLYSTSEKDTEIDSTYLDNDTKWAGGEISIASGDGNATSLVGKFTTTETTVNIQSINGGTDTNVGPDQIQIMSGGVAGVESVTNQVSTGNTSYLNTNLDPFSPGQEGENDEELRERGFANTSIGGAATARSIGSKISPLPGVETVKIFKNKTGDPKNGLPGHSYEVLVYGGSDEDIAEAIYDTASIDSTDVGGVHGTEHTYTINDDLVANPITIHFSRPLKLNLDIEVDLIIDENYIGDSQIKSLITNYIGGTDVDGSFVAGTDAGEDLYEAVLKQKVVDPEETGVWEVDYINIDKNGDGTDDTVTSSSGADILEVADSEITQTNARDGSITINTSDK